MLHGGVPLGSTPAGGGKGAELGAALGGTHTPELRKHNALRLDPIQFEEQPGGASSSDPAPLSTPTSSAERARMEFGRAAAQARSEAMALQEAKLEADQTLQELKRQGLEMEHAFRKGPTLR